MARHIKSYNEKEDTVVEIAVTALNEKAAVLRGSMWLFGRTPFNITALKDIEVFEINPRGRLSQYRVIFTIDGNRSIRELIKVNEVIRRLEENL